MPIYEYGCGKCGKTFEYMQSMSDPAKAECEECGGQLRKLVSSTSFQLKGSGWYKDLYSSSKPKAGASSDASGSTDSSSSSSESSSGDKAGATTKTETKPKTDTKPAKPDKAKGGK